MILAGGDTPRGVRTVPQLRWGTTPIARSRTADRIVDALDAVLGGLDARLRAGDADVWVGYRLFTHDGHAVLLDVGSTTLLNDRTLERAGITEPTTWSLRIDTAGARVLLPPPLTATSNDWTTLELAGIVNRGHQHDDTCDHSHGPTSAGTLVRRHAAHHDTAAWFGVVRTLAEHGRLTEAATTADLRAAVTALL